MPLTLSLLLIHLSAFHILSSSRAVFPGLKLGTSLIMSGPELYHDSEKDISRMDKGGAGGSMESGNGSKEGATVIAGEVLVTKEQTTERGLKSRHAQMIALGGMNTSPSSRHAGKVY